MTAHTGARTKVFGGANQSVASWNVRDVVRDASRPGASFCLAHEIGHPLGLDEAYVDGAHRVTEDHSGGARRQESPGYQTQSNPGYEGNIMADFWSDVSGPYGRRRRPWLGATQARDLAVMAFRSRDTSLWPNEQLATLTRTRTTVFSSLQ